MDLNIIFSSFINECWDKLKLSCIIQFGSSTTTKNFDDIDLLFLSKNSIFTTQDYINLLGIFKDYEQIHKDLVFDIGGDKSIRNRKGKYSISIIPINKIDIKLIKKSSFTMDKFFFRNLSEDKSKKILFGENPFTFKINLNKKEIGQLLSLEINHSLRKCLEPESRLEAIYYLFKTTLRLMLTTLGTPSKSDLLKLFKNNYKIKLPKNSENILKHKLGDKDFESVLEFSEDCLTYLGGWR